MKILMIETEDSSLENRMIYENMMIYENRMIYENMMIYVTAAAVESKYTSDPLRQLELSLVRRGSFEKTFLTSFRSDRSFYDRYVSRHVGLTRVPLRPQVSSSIPTSSAPLSRISGSHSQAQTRTALYKWLTRQFS